MPTNLYEGQETIKKIKAYVETCVDDKPAVGNKFNANIPTVDGLAICLGVHRDTINEWSRKHPEFRDALDAMQAEQANRLINRGLSGQYNPIITKLVLSKHGYRDSAEIDHTTKGEALQSIPSDIAQEAAKLIHEKMRDKI